MSIRIDHIGILVEDLEQAALRRRPLLGSPARVRELPDAGLRVAEFRAENVTIELLQYTARDAAALARRTMGEGPGLNHVCAQVEDLDASVAALRGEGFEPMEGFPRQGSHGRIVFFHPDPVTGLLLEVCQPDG
ncbi:MAG: VOC family protein [Burkholderiales bacterium]|nr:MAG: VOC family protein [Burkholderiales bacterium]